MKKFYSLVSPGALNGVPLGFFNAYQIGFSVQPSMAEPDKIDEYDPDIFALKTAKNCFLKIY
jgi:hypothetical protein